MPLQVLKMQVLQPRVVAQVFKTVRNFSTPKKPSQEVSIPVPWGKITGKWWGPTDSKPVVTLHGWQDNCGSFDRTMPLMNPNVGFLCIDLPGHGYSSKLPSGLYYHFTDYLLTIRYIAKYLQYPSVALMGHSMGGVTSFVYSMLYPDEVDFTICVDGSVPFTFSSNRIQVYAQSLEKFMKYSDMEMGDLEPPSYSVEEIKRKICAPNDSSIMPEYAHHIMGRSVAPSKVNPGKFYFTRDPRLKAGAQITWAHSELLKEAPRIKSPLFICKAGQASYYGDPKSFYAVVSAIEASNPNLEFCKLQGSHHIHLNNPEELGGKINQFLEKHYKLEKNLIDFKAILNK